MMKRVGLVAILVGLFSEALWANDTACVQSGREAGTLVRQFLKQNKFSDSCVEQTVNVADTEAQYDGAVMNGVNGTTFFYENLNPKVCRDRISIAVTFARLYDGRCEALRLDHLQAAP